MFVEQVLWSVHPDQRTSCEKLLTGLAHSMDASGGLVRSLVGYEVGDRTKLVALSFWKGWEDLSRFLAGSNTALLNQRNQGKLESVDLHHYEVIWECSGQTSGIEYGAHFWSMADFSLQDPEIEPVLDAIRLFAPGLKRNESFLNAAIWLDKNNQGHLQLAVQWRLKAQALELQPILSQTNLKPSQVSMRLCETEVIDAVIKAR